ncbi:hypothetical protein GCM10027160_51210 [Streptomyces calidiresistens]
MIGEVQCGGTGHSDRPPRPLPAAHRAGGTIAGDVPEANPRQSAGGRGADVPGPSTDSLTVPIPGPPSPTSGPACADGINHTPHNTTADTTPVNRGRRSDMRRCSATGAPGDCCGSRAW